MAHYIANKLITQIKGLQGQ